MVNSIKYTLIGIFITSLLTSCVTPAAVKEKADKHLVGACSSLFNNSSIGGYQHMAQVQVVSARSAFALANDNSGNQVCAFTRPGELMDNTCLFDCQGTWAEIEALAISKCEQVKPKNNPNAYGPCKIFARNNEIVWGSENNEKVDFQ